MASIRLHPTRAAHATGDVFVAGGTSFHRKPQRIGDRREYSIVRHAGNFGLAAAGVYFAFVLVGCLGGGEVDPPDPVGAAGAAGTASGGGTIGSAGSGPGGTSGLAGETQAGTAGDGAGGQGNTAGQGNMGGTGGGDLAGRGGTGGGTAGTTGVAGRGGTTGSAGRGGSTGAAGRGGTTGTAGASGTMGRGGANGLGGIPGVAGRLQFVGNITTYNAVDTDGKVFSTYWDQISPENAGKWGSVQSNATAAFNWRTLDAIYDYTQQKGIIFKEHTFVWGNQQPGGSISEANVRTWMTEFCKRYPNTRLIDVVNEPPPHTTPSYANSIGGGTNGTWQWIINAFKWAREACPNAILLLNDYNNIEWTNDNNNFLGIVRTIKAGGAPIDAIGAQAHDLDHGSVNMTTVTNLLNKLGTDGALPIYITELDISTTDDNAQLQAYQRYFPLFRDSPHVRGITIWGWIYGKTWSPSPNSGLIRNGSMRPAMTWLMQQLGRPTQ
jgi:endo-1,4-beta-xylanase